MGKLKIDNSIKKAVAGCLEKHIPFCLYAFPGEEGKVNFFSNPGVNCLKDNDKEFIIGLWNQSFDNRISIKDEWDADATVEHLPDLVNYGASAINPVSEIQDENTYIERVTELIAEMKLKEIDKVVFSTNVSQDCRGDYKYWIDITEKVFDAYPSTFRYLYFTKETGAWLGATPELLVDYSFGSKSLRTIALAGTRNAKEYDVADDWDAKDKEEQRIVERFIKENLEEIGFEVECATPGTIETGHLQHIETVIKANDKGNGPISIGELLDRLQPTPALSGFPRIEALRLIETFEGRPRYCYGGIVGLKTDESINAYVNIRCVHFNEKSCCFYGGGGIMQRSEPRSEYSEAMSKIDSLKKFVK